MSCLADFGYYEGKGGGVGGLGVSVKICDKNLFQIMLNEVLKSCKKMISADIKTDAKQEIKELVPSQNLKYNVKQACIFNLILFGIPSSLILFVKDRG